MKNLGSFLTEYVSSKNNINKENNNDNVIDNKVNEEKTPSMKQILGKEPDNYGDCDVEWAIDEPTDNSVYKTINKQELSDNEKHLRGRFSVADTFNGKNITKDIKNTGDFFIMGEAGWGKTSIIKKISKEHKRHIITVYLDKADKEDLGGLPALMKGKDGTAVQDKAMPTWGKIMMDYPDEKFLLFFDEMNQADPGIQNALMPIVLEHVICGHKFKNFMVGAAGNFEHENEAGISELSGPLNSRFKPIIIWKTDEKAWKSAFKHIHKVWDENLSKELIDKFEENLDLFNNPREIDRNTLSYIYGLKNSDDFDLYNTEDWYEYLSGVVKEDLTRTQEKNLKELAEDVFNFMNNKGDKEEKKSTGRSSRKDINMVDENIKKAIKQGMKYGYIEQEEEVNGKKVMVKYGISEENINTIEEWDSEDCNAEMRERLINKFKNDGIEFKFKTDAEWKKKGYKDPNAD